MMSTGTPEDVAGYVKMLLADVAGDGGFVLSPGAVVDHCKPENMHAILDTLKKYGKY